MIYDNANSDLTSNPQLSARQATAKTTQRTRWQCGLSRISTSLVCNCSRYLNYAVRKRDTYRHPRAAAINRDEP